MSDAFKSNIRTVLVADDDVDYLSSCVRGFGAHRRVVTATNAADARAKAKREQLDLVVVELKLGAASGLELIKWFRAEFPDLRIALVSGYLSVAFAVAAVREGANVILFKPVTCDEILREIEGRSPATEPQWETPSLARAQWEHITRVLNDCDGNVSMAARRLGVYRQSLQRRLRKYSPRT